LARLWSNRESHPQLEGAQVGNHLWKIFGSYLVKSHALHLSSPQSLDQFLPCKPRHKQSTMKPRTVWHTKVWRLPEHPSIVEKINKPLVFLLKENKCIKVIQTNPKDIIPNERFHNIICNLISFI
jgi:hypothetical protein